jgi:hypothetical protein
MLIYVFTFDLVSHLFSEGLDKSLEAFFSYYLSRDVLIRSIYFYIQKISKKVLLLVFIHRRAHAYFFFILKNKKERAPTSIYSETYKCSYVDIHQITKKQEYLSSIVV